jgi:hypothetical protein
MFCRRIKIKEYKMKKAVMCTTIFTLISAQAAVLVSWESNGVLVAEGILPGSTCTVEWASSLDRSFTNSLFEGVVADNEGKARIEIPIFFRVSGEPNPPSEMAWIPEAINSGLDQDFGDYSLTSEGFFIDKYEVTKQKWDSVYTWAVENGYSFENSGNGNSTNHPVHSVNWFDCVKWCNARSEIEGRTPCYTEGNGVYKAGTNAPSCNFGSDGYRLPTEVEWEYAARGGLVNLRFPWGNEITHNQANYSSDDSIIYDTSETRGYHPDYIAGEEPYTSPAGSFPANNFGLFDMAGNIREWCWDSLDDNRSVRGGSWYGNALIARCGSAGYVSPHHAGNKRGFRAVCQ